MGGALAAGALALHGMLGGLFLGMLVALPQWLVLRPLIRHAIWWVPLTALGILSGWVGAFVAALFLVNLADILATYYGLSIEWLAIGIPSGMAGAILGLFQFLLLERAGPKAAWWIVANAFGCMLLWAFFRELQWDGLPLTFWSSISGPATVIMVGGALYG